MVQKSRLTNHLLYMTFFQNMGHAGYSPISNWWSPDSFHRSSSSSSSHHPTTLCWNSQADKVPFFWGGGLLVGPSLFPMVSWGICWRFPKFPGPQTPYSFQVIPPFLEPPPPSHRKSMIIEQSTASPGFFSVHELLFLFHQFEALHLKCFQSSFIKPPQHLFAPDLMVETRATQIQKQLQPGVLVPHDDLWWIWIWIC